MPRSGRPATRPGYIDDVALTPADYRVLAERTPSRSDRASCFRRALHELEAEQPGRYWTGSRLRRLRYFFLFDETNPKTRNLTLQGEPGRALTLLAAGRPDRSPRPEVRRRLGPTILTVALVAAFHALTIVSARFHLPIEPLMGLWAAAGLSRWEAAASAPPADDVEGLGIEGRLAGGG